jgi:hypothetical protein
MFKQIVASASLAAIVGAVPVLAQNPRVEVSGFAAWAFSDGVETDSAVVGGDGNVYDRVDPEDSGLFGFNVGFYFTENAQVGLIYGRQPSTLLVGGTADQQVGDLSISTYHGYFGYDFGQSDAKIRPFLYGGMGATNFGDVQFPLGAELRTIPGETRFSTTWGGGVKIFPSRHVGLRAAISLTPTYIATDSEGWWCDPYWGCYVVGNYQYSNQFGFSGGATLRF